MLQIPSWNWLSTPRGSRAVRSAAKAQKVMARPCLPVIEQLDDRVLLDATAPSSTDGGGTTNVLIGLLNKAATLSAGEFVVLGDIKGESQDHKHKDEIAQLGDAFLKLDDILGDFGNKILGGDTEDKGGTVMLKIEDTFLKIEGIVADLGFNSDSQLVQKVRGIEDAALFGDGSVYKGITALIGNLGGVSSDDLQKVMKISDTFVKIDEIVIKGEVKLDLGDLPPDPIRLADAFLKLDGLIGSISDSTLKSALQGFEKQFQGSIIGVLFPPGPSDGSFTGGITVAGGTLT